ncbi:MAG: hypothetical protein O3B01_28200 [Planctomycetota bacterium]|nr:hypothetical protein [Planctomycetota bacterium]
MNYARCLPPWAAQSSSGLRVGMVCFGHISDIAAVKGYYRFTYHKDHDSLSLQTILEPHAERTVRRMQLVPRALLVHDETDLNFSGLAECKDLGFIWLLRGESC